MNVVKKPRYDVRNRGLNLLRDERLRANVGRPECQAFLCFRFNPLNRIASSLLKKWCLGIFREHGINVKAKAAMYNGRPKLRGETR